MCGPGLHHEHRSPTRDVSQVDCPERRSHVGFHSRPGNRPGSPATANAGCRPRGAARWVHFLSCWFPPHHALVRCLVRAAFAARCFSSQRSCPSSIENTYFRACPALALFSSFANLWADTFRCPAPAGHMHSAALGSSGRNRTPRSGSRTTRWSWDHRGNWSAYSVDGFPGMTE